MRQHINTARCPIVIVCLAVAMGAATSSPAQQLADFNGDGYEDLAIGVPNDEIGEIDSAGAVNIIYGSKRGLRAKRNRRWFQDSPDMKEQSEEDDYFGEVIASGDFNGDGYSDLVVSAPYEALGTLIDAGVVHIMYGGPKGITAAGNQLFHGNSRRVPGEAQDHAFFGGALAAGDFDSDGYCDLAVGAPGHDFEGLTDAGAVYTFSGSPDGLAPRALWNEESAGAGVIEQGDRFGYELAAADFNGDGRDDLAIASPYQASGAEPDAGAVTVLYGRRSGLSARGAQVWHDQDLGGDEAGGRFGLALAVGDANGDRIADLAIGVPYKDLGGDARAAGAVALVYGSPEGLSQDDADYLVKPSAELGEPADGERFGQAIALGDFDGNGCDDLAVGIPGQDVIGVRDAGAVTIHTSDAGGLRDEPPLIVTQDRGRIDETPEEGDHFGIAVAARDFNGDGRDDLAVGVPWEEHEGVARAGLVHVLHGGKRIIRFRKNQIWHQNAPKIRGVLDVQDLFGDALN